MSLELSRSLDGASTFLLSGGHQPFWRYWNLINERTRSIEHRGGDGRRSTVHRQFANALRAEWSVRILLLDYDRLDLGRVERSRNDVVRQPVVDDPAVVPNQLFEQTVADCLKRASFDLTRREHRMNRAADVLGRGYLRARYFVGVHVNFDFGHLRAPRVRRISVARIGFVVPFNLGWTCIASVRAQLTALGDVLASDLLEARQVFSILNKASIDQLRFRRAEALSHEVDQLLLDFAGSE